jgi:TPR repeat protein
MRGKAPFLATIHNQAVTFRKRRPKTKSSSAVRHAGREPKRGPGGALGWRSVSVRTDIFKPATKPHWVSQRERAATRDALIGVARGLVARKGELALTLGAVADEAGMARATVYGFFSGRGELLRALVPAAAPSPEPVADAPPPQDDDPSTAIWASCQSDLHAFLPEDAAVEDQPEPTAAAQPEVITDDGSEDWIVYEASVETEPAEEVQAAVEEPAPDAAVAVEEVAVEEAKAEEPAEEVEQPEPVAEAAPATVDTQAPEAEEPAHASQDVLSEQDERRRQQAAHLEEIAKRLILPESAIREGTDAVIARLDTRIRVLEKSISGLETRQAANENEAARRLEPLSDDIEKLQTRSDSTDARQLKTVAELRLSIHHLETRMEALEAPQRGAVSGALNWPEPAPEQHQQVTVPESSVPDAAPVEEDAASDGAPQSENVKHAYLTAVRGIAQEGARQAAEREAEVEEEQAKRRRRVMAAAAVAIVSLGAAGALFIFHPGSHGISTAQSKPAPFHVTAQAAHPALAPLDRLSALAEKGNASAELLIGLKYLEGGHSDAQAAHWLERASDHGNAVAQNALGALYQSGRGVSADPAKATRLYLASAGQGNRHAMSNLAVLYAGAGQGMKDYTEASRWFERSASLGYVDAQFNLAVLYERGDGVPQSLIDAYKWYAIAAASGDAVAKQRADAIATQLSPEEQAAAHGAVAEFKPQALNKQANDVPAMPQVLAAR